MMSKVFMDGADPIIIEDLEGRILQVNDETLNCYGWSREELGAVGGSSLGSKTDPRR